MTALQAIPEDTARTESVRRSLLKVRADESQKFWTRERAVMRLADSLLGNEYPAKVVRGLQAEPGRPVRRGLGDPLTPTPRRGPELSGSRMGVGTANKKESRCLSRNYFARRMRKTHIWS